MHRHRPPRSLAHAGGVDVARDADPEADVAEAPPARLPGPAPPLAFDLADFLAWQATGTTGRSQCTLACKWSYLAARARPAGRTDFLAARRPRRPPRPRPACRAPATPVAADLGPLTRRRRRGDLGLTPATRVAAGLIDAHAGALGVLGHLAGARRDRAPPRR